MVSISKMDTVSKYGARLFEEKKNLKKSDLTNNTFLFFWSKKQWLSAKIKILDSILSLNFFFPL